MKSGRLTIPAEVFLALDPDERASLAAGAFEEIVVDDLARAFPTPTPDPPRWRVVALAALAALLAVGAFLLGQHRAEPVEDVRTRRAVCLVLDELGADAATAEQAEPCRDTPAGS